MKQRCTLKFFWLGLMDWLGSNLATTHTEVVKSAIRESEGFARPVLFLLLPLFALALMVKGALMADQHKVFQGVSTASAVNVVGAVSQVVVLGAILYVAYKIISSTLNFCSEMCARGQLVAAKRAGLTNTPS